MKISEKILKRQQGGEISPTGTVFGHGYNPLMNLAPTKPETVQTSRSSSKKKSSTDDDLVDDKLLKQLVGKGITSDVNASISTLVEMQQAYNNLDEVEKNSNQGLMLLNQIQNSSAKVNALLRNAKRFDDQQSTVVGKKALNELALTENGVILQDLQTQKISVVPVEQIASADPEELKNYRFLTNAELINEREYRLQNDVLSFEQLNQSTSFNEIREVVTGVLASLGSTSSSNMYDAYTGSQMGKNDLRQVLDQIRNLSQTEIDNIVYTIKDTNNNAQLGYAIDAIWSTLSENMRTYLKQKALSYGATQQDLNDVAKSFIIKLVSPRQVSDSEMSLKSDLGKNSDGTTKSKTSKLAEEDKIDLAYWDYLQNDSAPAEDLPLAPEGTFSTIQSKTRAYGALRDHTGKIYQYVPILNVSELNGVANVDAVSFGKEHFPKEMLQGMQYQGDQVYERYLPYKYDENAQIVPDFDLLPKYDAQLKIIQSKERTGKKLTASEKMQIFISQGITDLNVDGNPTKIAPFYQTKVYVGEQIYDELPESAQKLLTEVTSNAANSLMQETFAHSKELIKRNKNGIWKDGDDVYAGQIYMPKRKLASTGVSQIEDSKIGLADLKRRMVTAQSQQGISNQTLAQPQSLELLNSIMNDK